jgi:hypothetical protein
MNKEDDEYVYFWEVNSIYDNDGDLLIWSLMGVCFLSFNEAMFYSNDFFKIGLYTFSVDLE